MEAVRIRNVLRFEGVCEDENENLLSVMLHIINGTIKVKCSNMDIVNVC